jgi:hypothetical protein
MVEMGGAYNMHSSDYKYTKKTIGGTEIKTQLGRIMRV